MFLPPSTKNEKPYFWVIRATSCLPLLVLALTGCTTYFTAFLRRTLKAKAHQKDWKPWTIGLSYLSFVMSCTILLIVTIIMLTKISNLPHPNKTCMSLSLFACDLVGAILMLIDEG